MSALDFSRLDGVLARHPQTTLDGNDRLADERMKLLGRFGILQEPNHPLGEISPPPKLVFPDPSSFLPDLLLLGDHWICSARLRAALSLPPDVAQYIPLLVDAPDPRVHSLEYQIIRIIAGQTLLDMSQSDVRVQRVWDRFIGGEVELYRFPRRWALLNGVQAQTDLFHAAESPLHIFARDNLAERVMKAGCLGMEFTYPEHPALSNEEPLIRTARGVERRSPATRAAHLRLVRRVRGGSLRG